MEIRQACADDGALLAALVSEANKDVAQRFGLNAENCPKHPSFCTAAWIDADFARGERYFILEDGAAAVGCVAYERPGPGRAYLNRLSVLPEHRKRGAGARLVQYIARLAASESVGTISIGVIGEHVELKRWYERLGFTCGEVKRFQHLPFPVQYMAYAVPPQFPPGI
jgi:diamine N-acetyltransferase